MAANTTFADVNVAAEDLQWSIRFNAGDRRDVFLDEEHGNELDQTADYDCDCRQRGECKRNSFEPTMAEFRTLSVVGALEGRSLGLLITNEFACFSRFV